MHCQPNVIGIEVAQELLRRSQAVFGFAAIRPSNQGVPVRDSEEYYDTHRIRNYGFHGINHSYVAQEAARFLKCHLSV
jgi:acetate kinase